MTNQTPAPTLDRGRTYSWAELEELFDFKPGYLGSAGGMVSRPAMSALMLITHPEGGKSFDYGDFWQDGDLQYAGRGQDGDMKLDGQNRDVADNAKRLYVFEKAGVKQLRFLGEASCVGHRWELAPDKNKAMRRVVRFRLRFDDDAGEAVSATSSEPAVSAVEGGHRWVLHRKIERKRSVVVAAKKAWLASDPLLRCEACGFSFVKTYGDAAGDYIEAHHRVPLSALKGEPTNTVIADLAPLCANCHRVLHLQPELTVGALKARLEG